MPSHTDTLRVALSRASQSARELAERLKVSQPTVSRALGALGNEVVRIRGGRAIQYALRDDARSLDDIAVYRVSREGKLRKLGSLIPVRQDGFVMVQEDGETLHSFGLPWWLIDMCPQGFLGRVYATRHAANLGLPPRLSEWTDSHMLRALLAHGHDVVGNLLLGDRAREHFLQMLRPEPVDESCYPKLAESAQRGDVPGSSAGGEQPKFAAFVGRHVLVKFTAIEDNLVSRRWRDLLLAEHLATSTLREAGVPAPITRLHEIEDRRFLESERFDRVGDFGRLAVHSLHALDAEFVGEGNAAWPVVTGRLAEQGIITRQAHERAGLLYAFGTLIGNTDMHPGNLSFISERGRPYALSPAYDMLPMGFAPLSGGRLPNELPQAHLHAQVDAATWRQALTLAENFLVAIGEDARFSADWRPCAQALSEHIAHARMMIERLG